MKKLVFASNNAHKLAEIRSILAGRVEVVSLSDIDCHDDIPETADTLEVEALDGAPGVYSARFAGEKATFEDNISLLLERLQGVPAPRRAAFRTVIALIDEYGTHLFEGSVVGEITEERLGGQGFGYDPVFLPAGQTKTFAQLTESEKNSMSHRGRAIQKLASYLCALHEA